MVKKVILILAIMILIVCGTNLINVKACDNIIGGADNFVNSGKGSTDGINETKMKEGSSLLYNVLLTIGICVAIIIGAILGIQFMVGSVEQKAKVKDSLIPFVVGCVIIFGAFGIWRMVLKIGATIDKASAIQSQETRILL